MTTFKSFQDLDGDFINDNIVFRLIHFWESRKFTQGNILMGLELFFVEEKSAVVQGFISKNRKPKMRKFALTNPKTMYKVSDHKHIVCFTDQIILDEVETEEHQIPSQHFRLLRVLKILLLLSTQKRTAMMLYASSTATTSIYHTQMTLDPNFRKV